MRQGSSQDEHVAVRAVRRGAVLSGGAGMTGEISDRPLSVISKWCLQYWYAFLISSVSMRYVDCRIDVHIGHSNEDGY